MRRSVSSLASLSALSLWVVASTLGAACANPPPPVPPVVASASAPIPEPPAPVRARWTYTHPGGGVKARLDLGDGQTLYVGVNGRRSLAKGDEPMIDAPTLALESLAGVLRDDKGQFVFVATDGDVFVSKEPLGQLDVTRPGPLESKATPGGVPELVQIATGKAAILGVTVEGALVRSGDYGTTWAALDYQGASKILGRAASVAIDAKGHGLLLHFPQRLFVTQDDGATWTPIASPGFAARYVFLDGAGRVFLEGPSNEHATLQGNSLAVSSEGPVAIFTPKKNAPTPSAGGETHIRSILTGDHVVDVTTLLRRLKPSEVRVASRKLGESAGDITAGTTVDAFSSRITRDGALANYEASLMYAKDDDVDESQNDAPPATTTLFRSDDYGASWQKDTTVPGTLNGTTNLSTGVVLAIGPKGWAYTAPLCKQAQAAPTPKNSPGKGSSTGTGRDCGHRQIRPGGASTFEDLVGVEEFVPRSFAFDEAHDRVYVLGDRAGRRYVYESPLGQNKFTRTKLLDISENITVHMTVDPSGTLRLLRRESSVGAAGAGEWVLSKRDSEGKELPDLHLDLTDGSASLSGLHGLILGPHKSWETADGGETWMRVPSNGNDGTLACTAAGCKMASTQRVGWDLPAYTADEKVAATTEPTKRPNTRPTPPPKPAGHEAVELACKTTGLPHEVEDLPSMFDLHPSDLRWLELRRNLDDSTAVIVAGKTSVRDYSLLGPEPRTSPAQNIRYRQTSLQMPDGAVSVRYSFSTVRVAGQLNPVDVEIAWFSAKTGKTTRHTLKQVKPFRVSGGFGGLSGSLRIVEGGLVFQGNPSDVVNFIHDDGKVETMTVPEGAEVGSMIHAGTRWIMSESSNGALRLTWSDDGKTWTTRGWGLEDSGYAMLGWSQGKLLLEHGSTHTGRPPTSYLFGLEGAFGPEPPAPVHIDDAAGPDARCDASVASVTDSDDVPMRNRWLIAHIDETDTSVQSFIAEARILHVNANGARCTSAYRLTAGPHKPPTTPSKASPASSASMSKSLGALLFPEENGWSGWRFREAPDPRTKGGQKIVGEAMLCSPAGEARATPAKK